MPLAATPGSTARPRRPRSGARCDRAFPVNEAPGIGGRVGFGESPALVVVDMSLAFTDPEGPLRCDLDETTEAIAGLLEVARAQRVPIVFTTVAYGDRERTSARAMLKK